MHVPEVRRKGEGKGTAVSETPTFALQRGGAPAQCERFAARRRGRATAAAEQVAAPQCEDALATLVPQQRDAPIDCRDGAATLALCELGFRDIALFEITSREATK